jgi:predicted  nucleic acid-binding Zn-ribbon protein
MPPASSSPLSREQELDILNQQAENLSAALQEIRHRIDQLQRQSSSSSS